MPQASHTDTTDRAELVAIRESLADLITRLGFLSARAPQPGLHIDDAICQIADAPATLDAALEELDEALDFADALDAGEDWAVRQASWEAMIEAAEHRGELAREGVA